MWNEPISVLLFLFAGPSLVVCTENSNPGGSSVDSTTSSNRIRFSVHTAITAERKTQAREFAMRNHAIRSDDAYGAA
jgi:hypothetical protein